MTVPQNRNFLYLAGTKNRDIAPRLDDGEICVLGTVLGVELVYHASMRTAIGVLSPLNTGAAYTAAHGCDDFGIGHICIRILSICIKGEASAKSCDEGLRRYLFRAHLDALHAVGFCGLELLSQIILVQAQSLANGFDIELFCGTEVIVAVASGRNLRDVHGKCFFQESGLFFAFRSDIRPHGSGSGSLARHTLRQTVKTAIICKIVIFG